MSDEEYAVYQRRCLGMAPLPPLDCELGRTDFSEEKAIRMKNQLSCGALGHALLAQLLTHDGAFLADISRRYMPTPEATAFAAFALGTLVGQAEKVSLGACRVFIIRPHATWHAWAKAAMKHICGHYGLEVVEYTPLEELWGIAPQWRYLVDYCHSFPYPSDQAHMLRARLCGIPASDVDMAYHLRDTHGARWEIGEELPCPD